MKWINIKDDLPEEETDVICHCKGNTFHAIHESDGKFYKPSIRSDSKVSFYIQVSDWMKFPKPPTN